MQLNQKLINDLREGRIVLKNEPKNPEAVKQILKAAWPGLKFGQDFFKREKYAARGTNGLPHIPIADFLRPEPKFKLGDKVCHVNNSNINGKIQCIEYELTRWIYVVSGYSGIFKEEKLELVSEAEPEFEIGKMYEFSDDEFSDDAEDWHKGKLLAIVDHKDKYVAGYEDMVMGRANIRDIQPVKIERWINVSQSGNQIGENCFASKIEACQNAPQQYKIFQVKLEGIYTFNKK